jgi:hypothetical protein
MAAATPSAVAARECLSAFLFRMRAGIPRHRDTSSSPHLGPELHHPVSRVRLIVRTPNLLSSSPLRDFLTMANASRNSILRLINASQHSACPCHGCRPAVSAQGQLQSINQLRNYASPINAVEKEYAFEARILLSTRPTYVSLSKTSSYQVAASNLRFGDGVTAEVGMDLKNMGARKVPYTFTHPRFSGALFRPLLTYMHSLRLAYSPTQTSRSSGQ